MTQPFTFEALADGSANVYKDGRYIGNIQNAAEMGVYCTHENERLLTVNGLGPEHDLILCLDCGKTREREAGEICEK